jgi:hypothetical protein
MTFVSEISELTEMVRQASDYLDNADLLNDISKKIDAQTSGPSRRSGLALGL